MSGNTGPLLTLVVTVCLGGAILYLLNRLRRTDREIHLLNSLARQNINISDVRTVATKIFRETQPKPLPDNFEQIVANITEHTVRRINNVSTKPLQEQIHKKETEQHRPLENMQRIATADEEKETGAGQTEIKKTPADSVLSFV